MTWHHLSEELKIESQFCSFIRYRGFLVWSSYGCAWSENRQCCKNRDCTLHAISRLLLITQQAGFCWPSISFVLSYESQDNKYLDMSIFGHACNVKTDSSAWLEKNLKDMTALGSEKKKLKNLNFNHVPWVHKIGEKGKNVYVMPPSQREGWGWPPVKGRGWGD